MVKKNLLGLLVLLLVFLTSCDFIDNKGADVEAKFDQVQSILDSSFGEVITEDINIPSTLMGVALKWTSDKEEFLTNEGMVTRGSEDVLVLLTVEMQYKNKTRKITYVLTVRALANAVIDVYYTVNFNSQGGTNVLAYKNVEGRTRILEPVKPTRDGYYFSGWFKEEECINEWDFKNDLVTRDVILYAKWDEQESIYIRDGDYIYFGEYPQTIKAQSVGVGTTQDSRGYYLGSDGASYAKVVASPDGSGYTFSDDSNVISGTTYYFKVEPIKWRILTESNGEALVLCENIIANKRYAESINNYKNSEIRAWLNNEFYNTAFTELQKQIIQTTEVDNSKDSTGSSYSPYVCENTFDKVFLLSYREVTNSNYGFASDNYSYDPAKQKLTSDYSRSTGVYMNTSSSYFGNGIWCLRSPYDYYSSYVRYVDNDSYVRHNYYVSNASGGVVPALKIKLI